MIGRAFLYSLGAMGEAGVTTMLEILQKELDVSMALTGTKDIREVNASNITPPLKAQNAISVLRLNTQAFFSLASIFGLKTHCTTGCSTNQGRTCIL